MIIDPPSPEDALFQVWLKLAKWFLRRRVLNLVNVLSLLSWKRTWLFTWTNLNSLHSKMCSVKFGWNWPCCSWEKDFYTSSMHFGYIVIITPWKRSWLFIWTNWNLLYSRMLCAKFDKYFPGGSGEEDKNMKVYVRTDDQTHDRWSEKLIWAFQLRWPKKTIRLNS